MLTIFQRHRSHRCNAGGGVEAGIVNQVWHLVGGHGKDVYSVKLIVREAKQGPPSVSRFKFYDVTVLKDKLSPKVNGLDTSTEALAVRPSPIELGYTVSDLLQKFKDENERHIPQVSKVVDSHGKPLVVYHGSDTRITNGQR